MTELSKKIVDPKIYENELKELEKKLDTAEEQVIKLIGEKYGIQI